MRGKKLNPSWGGIILAAVQWVSLLRGSLVLCLVWEHCTLSAYVSTFSFLDSFLFPLCLCVFIASSSSWKHRARFCTQTGPVIAGNCVCLVSWLWEIPLFPPSLSRTFSSPRIILPASGGVSHRSANAALAWDHTKLPVKYREQEITR